jgi:hypothetical protein
MTITYELIGAQNTLARDAITSFRKGSKKSSNNQEEIL